MARHRGVGRGRGGRRAEQRSGKERGREKEKKENRKKKRGKERRERERERDRARASDIRGGDRGWSATRALSGDTQRVARSGKKKMGRQPNSGVGTAKIAGKGFEKN